MRLYIGFDDTDTADASFGTGKLARAYEKLLPPGCTIWGVVRQQLLIDPRIPYTSHNSSACVVVNCSDPFLNDELIRSAIDHLVKESAQGSDPGLCFVCEGDPALPALMEFGRLCATRVCTQRDAREAAGQAHLSGHGGTSDGIIGAAAAVGLTASGWCGRFIEFSGLRGVSNPVSVGALVQRGIRVIALDRDATIPRREDLVDTRNWLRPRLWGHAAILPVLPQGSGLWQSMGEKRQKTDHPEGR